MEDKYLVRIIKTALYNFKNVGFGEICYGNYNLVNKEGVIGKKDIIGIYGQNGSGKTAMVEAMAILKCILSGEEILYSLYGGLLSEEENTKIETTFYIRYGEDKYKALYEVVLYADHNEKKICILSEKLVYWRRGATWKTERVLEIHNPYYDKNSILNDVPIMFSPGYTEKLNGTVITKGLQNLAVYCAQKSLSIFFNDLMVRKLPEENAKIGAEEKTLYSVIRGLSGFGKFYFQVVKVNQLADINKNAVLPVNIHAENSGFIMHGCLPLVMEGTGRTTESLYIQLNEAIKSINIALQAIIPDLKIEIRNAGEERDKDGNKNILAEVYSVRGKKEFLTKYESEGIKRIISLLNYLISLYNYPEVCLVVDELDSGIFEYLLGEILGVLNEEAEGQLIFTSHNLRALEKLDIKKNIICTTTNPQNRYIHLTGKQKNHNPRDFYIRTITVGGQKEVLYDEADLQSIGYSFRKACKPGNNIKISFSDKFKKKLERKNVN